MSFVNGPVFTSAGKALLARATAGATLTFTKMQLGEGDRGPTAIESLTGLVSPVASVGISSIRHSGNFTSVVGIFSNADLNTGFNWNEIGLFAADPDNPDDRSKDILYCYQDAAGNPDYIAASGSALITKRIGIAAITDNAANVSAVIGQTEKAEDVTFDNEGTGLAAGNVQAAIEELSLKMGNIDPVKLTKAVPVEKGGTGATTAAEARRNLGVPSLDAAGRVPADQLPDITPESIGAATAADYNATVTTSWTESGGLYYQDLTVPGILATDNPIPGVAYGTDNAANVIYDDCFGKVLRFTTSANSIRVWAKKAISTAFPVQFKVVR